MILRSTTIIETEFVLRVNNNVMTTRLGYLLSLSKIFHFLYKIKTDTYRYIGTNDI